MSTEREPLVLTKKEVDLLNEALEADRRESPYSDKYPQMLKSPSCFQYTAHRIAIQRKCQAPRGHKYLMRLELPSEIHYLTTEPGEI